MRKCQLCNSAPVRTARASYCETCYAKVRADGKKASAQKHGHTNTRLYSLRDSVWPRGYGLTRAEWLALLREDPDAAGAPLADRKGRLFQLTPAGPVAVAQDTIIRSATFVLQAQHTHDDAPGAIKYTVQE